MSDEGNGQRSGSDADEEEDVFDVLDDANTEIGGSDGTDTEIDDPFAELGAGVDGDDSGTAEPAGFDADDVADDPIGSDDGDRGTDQFPPGDVAGVRRDDPFDEIGPADPETDLDDAFEQMDVGDAAEEDVWEALDADADGVGEATSGPGGGDAERVVSKRTYCQQCPHFTAPPEVACTHEGTSILEAVGFDEFRVRNCPMVSEEDPTFDAGE